MLPIGPLMMEHRLIEKMIAVMREKSIQARAEHVISVNLVDAIVDFIRYYADKTHHGKEEDILFRELGKKDLSAADQRTMRELVDDHNYSRGVVRELVEARNEYADRGAASLGALLDRLDRLARFYPEHIRKEDQVFFPASMTYLTQEEQATMLGEFWEFDRRMIHEKYKAVVEALE